MKIDEFIAESLKGIADGVANAQEEVNAIVNPGQLFEESDNIGSARSSGKFIVANGTNGILAQVVDFDLAVAVLEESKTEGKAGIFIASMGLGIKGGSNISTSLVNRIKFSIPIVLNTPKIY